jgi:nitric oxide reductase NorD protein
MPVTRIDFDWEERLFVWLRSIFRTLNPKALAHNAEGAISFQDCEERLRMLAQIMAAEPVKVGVSEHSGGLKGATLLFPRSVSLSVDPKLNLEVYIFRAIFMGHLRKILAQSPLSFSVDQPPHKLFLRSFSLMAQALHELEKDFTAFASVHARLRELNLRLRPDRAELSAPLALIEGCRQAFLRGQRVWEDEQVEKELSLLASDASLYRRKASKPIEIYGEILPLELSDGEMGIPEELEKAQSSSGTELEAPPKDEIEQIRFSKEDLEDNMMVHIFEKVETADEYKGGNRQPDGDDELEDHLDALQELDIREVIRGGEEAGSIYKAELRLDTTIPDVESIGAHEKGIPYDEWDQSKRSYKKDWCTVYPATITGRDTQWPRVAMGRHAALIRRLERELLFMRHRLESKDRQLDGEEIDMTALVDDWAFRSAGQHGEERLYTRQTRSKRDVAVTLLLDLSLSSDAWVGGRRVLNVSRDAVFVLGETAERLGDSVEVLGFASHTRNRCRVWSILERDEPWSKGRDRLGLLTPRGYTRIGPALRHATRRLVQTPAERRLLILISDGKPNDYDHYEGRHGIFDIRQALREAHRDGVQVQALAVDAVARDYLPAMFGTRAWQVLRHPDDLPLVLTEIYGRMTSV